MPSTGFGGYLGPSHDPFLIKQDASSPSFSVDTFDPPDDLDTSRMTNRQELLRSLDRYQADQEKQLEFARVHDAFREQALSLSTSTKAKEAFDLTKEPDKLRDTYGRNQVGQGLWSSRPVSSAGRPSSTNRREALDATTGEDVSV